MTTLENLSHMFPIHELGNDTEPVITRRIVQPNSDDPTCLLEMGDGSFMLVALLEATSYADHLDFNQWGFHNQQIFLKGLRYLGLVSQRVEAEVNDAIKAKIGEEQKVCDADRFLRMATQLGVKLAPSQLELLKR